MLFHLFLSYIQPHQCYICISFLVCKAVLTEVVYKQNTFYSGTLQLLYSVRCKSLCIFLLSCTLYLHRLLVNCFHIHQVYYIQLLSPVRLNCLHVYQSHIPANRSFCYCCLSISVEVSYILQRRYVTCGARSPDLNDRVGR